MKDIIVRTLIAETGHVITQAAETLPEGEHRVFASEVVLGAGDSAENWREITDRQARQYIARDRQ